MKRDEKVFLFHQGRSEDFNGAEEVDKKRAQTLMRTPKSGSSGENI